MNAPAVVKRVESRADEIISIAQQLVRVNTVNPYSGDPPEQCGGEAAGQAVIEPLLMFHMDTVGVTGMTIPPHSGDIRDGKLYGRGSSD